jgi:hypothetical protein
MNESYQSAGVSRDGTASCYLQFRPAFGFVVFIVVFRDAPGIGNDAFG